MIPFFKNIIQNYFTGTAEDYKNKFNLEDYNNKSVTQIGNQLVKDVDEKYIEGNKGYFMFPCVDVMKTNNITDSIELRKACDKIYIKLMKSMKETYINYAYEPPIGVRYTLKTDTLFATTHLQSVYVDRYDIIGYLDYVFYP